LAPSDDTTEAQGGAEEAHRRWPEGRSEQGASKAKVVPPDFEMRCRASGLAKSWAAKSFILGYVQWADRRGAVLSEKNSAPPALEKWVRRGR
jgi:hypothetical protein